MFRSMKYFAALAVVIWMALAGVSFAEDCLDYSFFPHWISQVETSVWASDVIVEGDLAYLALRTGGIAVVDVTNPWFPQQIGVLVGAIEPGWSATADRLVKSGDHLFISDGTGRKIHVVNVEDPTAPYLVTSVDTPVFPDGLALKDPYLYVAIQYAGVEIYDITDPALPQLVFSVSHELTHNVRIFGDLLFVTGFTNSVGIYSLQDPSSPVVLSEVTLPDEMETYDVAMLESLAYVSGALGTWIVDCADPETAALVGTLPTGASSITIEDGRAYLTPHYLEVYDLTDPLNPTPVHILPTAGFPSAPLHNLEMVRGVAFVAADDAGLLMADFSGYDWPEPVGSYDLPGNIEDLNINQDFALAAAGSEGLWVLNIDDPTNPNPVVHLESENAKAVISVGSLAYLADGGDGLKIVDMATPSSPQLLGHYDTYSRLASGLAIDGNLVFLAADLNGLMIIDVSDSTDPSLVAQTTAPVRARDVGLAGTWAFVADRENGLTVLDVSVPANPLVAATLELPGHLETIAMADSVLYIGGTGSAIWAIDIQDPTQPTPIGWLPFEAKDLVLQGDFLLAPGSQGVTLVECRNPAELKSVGFFSTWDHAQAVALVDSYMLVGGSDLIVALKHCPSLTNVDSVYDFPEPQLGWTYLKGVPNPFNPRIEISFESSKAQHLSLEVYDLTGRKVATLASGIFAARDHRVEWNGRDSQGKAAASGFYFVLLRGEQKMQAIKVTLVR